MKKASARPKVEKTWFERMYIDTANKALRYVDRRVDPSQCTKKMQQVLSAYYFARLNLSLPEIMMRAAPDEQSSAMESFCAAQVLNHGNQILLPSVALAAQLEHSDFTGVTIRDIGLPYQAFFVGVPNGIKFLYPESDRTLGEEVSGAFVYGDDQKIFVTIVSSELDGTNGVVCVWVDRKSASMDQVLEKLTENHNGENFVANCVAWIFKVIFYSTMPSADVHYIKCSNTCLWSERMLSTDGGPRRHWRLRPPVKMVLGTRTTIDRSMPTVVGRSRDSRVQCGSRVLVTGHWRRCHVGKRSASRIEWRFIEPFWRGPEDGPIAEKKVHDLGPKKPNARLDA